MHSKKKINSSTILYTKKYENTVLGDYYNFLLEKIIKNLNLKKYKLKINFTGELLKADLNIWFQIEHTIIKKSDIIMADIAYADYLNKMDYIFDYTITNTEHLKNFSEFKNIYDKIIYIPPLNSETMFFDNKKNREKNVITVHNPSPRRRKFFDLGYDNIFDTFDYKTLYNKLNNYKILLNVRQLDNNLSLEELRITPLLFSGILVLSEKTLYIEKLPHFKHIIWTNYNEIEDRINDISKNYSQYKEKYQEGICSTFKDINNYINNEFKKIFKNL